MCRLTKVRFWLEDGPFRLCYGDQVRLVLWAPISQQDSLDSSPDPVYYVVDALFSSPEHEQPDLATGA